MRTAIIIGALALFGCTYAEDYRAEFFRENPETRYAKEINAGHVAVGMTEWEAKAANPSLSLEHQMSFKGGGWSRTWRDYVTYVYVDDGYVTAVSWHGR